MSVAGVVAKAWKMIHNFSTAKAKPKCVLGLLLLVNAPKLVSSMTKRYVKITIVLENSTCTHEN